MISLPKHWPLNLRWLCSGRISVYKIRIRSFTRCMKLRDDKLIVNSSEVAGISFYARQRSTECSTWMYIVKHILVFLWRMWLSLSWSTIDPLLFDVSQTSWRCIITYNHRNREKSLTSLNIGTRTKQEQRTGAVVYLHKPLFTLTRVFQEDNSCFFFSPRYEF